MKPTLLKPILIVSALLLTPLAALHADDEITWLIAYDAKALPDSTWTAIGKPNAKIANGTLHLVDDSATESGAFRAAWKPQPDTEIVVEAKVRVEFVKARRDGTGMWPAQQGVPVGLLVSDGKHQEGLLLCPERIANWHDRVAFMDASKEFHTYRLVIHGNDMSITVDGVEKIHGEGAFWKPAENGEAFVQFGSTAPGWKGGAFWQSVKLGVRKASAPASPTLRITVSEPWEIPPPPGWDKPRPRGEALRTADTEIGIAVPGEAKSKPHPPTRPYLYNVGEGVLLLSVAQGPDAVYEPYGVLRSTDVGKTWQPIADLQFKSFAPQPHLRPPRLEPHVQHRPRPYLEPSHRHHRLRRLQLHRRPRSQSRSPALCPRRTEPAGAVCGSREVIPFRHVASTMKHTFTLRTTLN